MRRRSCSILLIISFTALYSSGCGPSTVSPTSAEEEHLEHHIPAHKPATFTDAVEALRNRIRHVGDESAAGRADHLAGDLSELRDIVDWLPELAADSDMRKADWDEVNALTAELRGNFQNLHGDGTSAGLEPQSVEQFLYVVSRLEPFISKTGDEREPGKNDKDRHHSDDDHDDHHHDHGRQQ